MINSKIIGNKISEARKNKNFSQAKLAEQIFISAQAVGKWERGESMPDIVTLNNLAEILGVDLNYFSDTLKTGTSDNNPVESVNMEPSKTNNKMLNWDMSRGNWIDADFSGLKNIQERFNASNMQRCKFIGSDLSGLILRSNYVDSCDFSGSKIQRSHIQNSYLNICKLNECKLNETEFSKSNINNCDFSGSDLSGTKFLESYVSGCNLNGVNFTVMLMKSGGLAGTKTVATNLEKNVIAEAIWNNTSFINSHIADIVFEGTIQDCYFENCAFTRVTFQNATISNTFFKNNKKLNRIQFINCKVDRMTYEFLKSGNADLTGIELITS